MIMAHPTIKPPGNLGKVKVVPGRTVGHYYQGQLHYASLEASPEAAQRKIIALQARDQRQGWSNWTYALINLYQSI